MTNHDTEGRHLFELSDNSTPSTPRGDSFYTGEKKDSFYLSDSSTPSTPQEADFNAEKQKDVFDLSDSSVTSTPTEAVSEASILAPVTRKQQLKVLLYAFVTVVMTIGPSQSYGVFQQHYANSNMLPPDERKNRSTVALVGTLETGLTWGGSIVVNYLMNKVPGHANRKIATVGCVLMALGYGLAGSSTRVWHLLLSQGVLWGIGGSMFYYPLLSVAPEYFDGRRGAAMGFILSGAGVGGLIQSPAIRALLSAVGARWTLRILAIVYFTITLPIALTAAPSRSMVRRPTHVSMAIARRPAFIFQVCAAVLNASGNFVPIAFLPEYSTTIGYSVSFAASLLAIQNGVNAVARVVMGLVSDKLGRQNTLIVGAFGSAISVWVLWMISATSGGGKTIWVVFVVIYGIVSGAYTALFPTTIAEVFGVHAYASVNGFIYFVRGLGTLFGNPVGGLVLGAATPGTGLIQRMGDFQNLIWYDGALLLGSSICVVGVRYFDAMDKKRWAWRA